MTKKLPPLCRELTLVHPKRIPTSSLDVNKQVDVFADSAAVRIILY